jgi:hypothetical protein
MTETYFKIRRKSDGLYFWSPEWQVSHSRNGKFYDTFPRAKLAFHNAKLDPADHEFVEYEVRETGIIETGIKPAKGMRKGND